jgi:hypothetical protein
MCLLPSVVHFHVAGSNIEVPLIYFVWVFISDVVIRAVLTLARAWEQQRPSAKFGGTDEERQQALSLAEKSFGRIWWDHFWGRSDWFSDYLTPFFIGLFELTGFPFFVAIGEWKVIGGWLAIKTVVEWKGWTENRSHFQRFLLGNAMVIALSVLLAQMLTVSKT